jgi:hypothetical protein
MCDDDEVKVYVPISNNSLNPPNENVISHRNENKYKCIREGPKRVCRGIFLLFPASIFLLIKFFLTIPEGQLNYETYTKDD